MSVARILKIAAIILAVSVASPAVTATALLARGAYVREQTGWELLTQEAEFSPRDSASGFFFNGHLWLSNGYYHGSKLLRDLWRSSDGQKWTQVTDETPYDGYAQISILNDKALAVLDTSWQSADGEAWEKIGNLPREGATIGSLATLNGSAYYVDENNVFRSQDGASWTKITDRAPFTKRGQGTLVAFKGKLIYVGGATNIGESGERGYDNLRSHADVWSSEDGISWTRIVDKGPWQPRMWPTLSVKNNLLWMFGGFNNETNANLNTLWVSPNARDWYPVDFRNGPSARHFATAIAVDEGIVLAAGNTWPVVNDVWLLRTPKYLVDLDLRAMWRKVRDSYQRWREQ